MLRNPVASCATDEVVVLSLRDEEDEEATTLALGLRADDDEEAVEADDVYYRRCKLGAVIYK